MAVTATAVSFSAEMLLHEATALVLETICSLTAYLFAQSTGCYLRDLCYLFSSVFYSCALLRQMPFISIMDLLEGAPCSTSGLL